MLAAIYWKFWEQTQASRYYLLKHLFLSVCSSSYSVNNDMRYTKSYNLEHIIFRRAPTIKIRWEKKHSVVEQLQNSTIHMTVNCSEILYLGASKACLPPFISAIIVYRLLKSNSWVDSFLHSFWPLEKIRHDSLNGYRLLCIDLGWDILGGPIYICPGINLITVRHQSENQPT